MIEAYRGSMGVTIGEEDEEIYCISDAEVSRDGQVISRLHSCSDVDADGIPYPETVVIPGAIVITAGMELKNTNNAGVVSTPTQMQPNFLATIVMDWGRAITGDFKCARWQYAGSTEGTIRLMTTWVSNREVTFGAVTS